MTSIRRKLCLSVILLTLVACGGQSADEHIAQAEQYLTAGDYNAATIELKNALQLDGGSARARWLLGKVYQDTGDAASAKKELLRARELGWNANEIGPTLAKALLDQGDFTDVREMSYKDLDPLPAAQLLSAQALAALAQGEPAKAEKLVALALEKQPDLLDAKMAEASLLAAQGDFTGALIVITEVLTQAPGHSPAWSLQGDILLRQQNLAEALVAFNTVIELTPNSFVDRLKRALIELQTGDYDGAQADTDYLLSVAPQHPASNYIQGLLHFKDQKYQEAITALSMAEPVAPQFPMVLFYLGSAHLVEGNRDQAAVFANNFVDIAPDNIAGRKLLATIRLQQGKFADVRELIQPVLDNSPDDVGAMNLMANAMLRDGETDAALILLARIAELQPDSPTAQVRLGAGLLLTGQDEAATEHMETALELNPEFQQADILLVLNHVQKGDFDEAIKAAKAYRRRNLASVTPHNLLGRVYLASGDNKKAIESFEKALTLNPGDPAAHTNLAQMAIAEGDIAAARRHYAVILEHRPKSLPTLLQLARLEAREQNEEALLQYLQRAMAAHLDALEPRLMLARYYLGTGKSEQVAPLFSAMSKIQQQSPQVLQLLAMAQLSNQDHAGAQYTLEQLVSNSPATPSSHHMLAMAAAGGGDNERVKEELQRALALDENYLPSLLAMARIAFAEQSSEEFGQYMQKLLELAPKSPDVLRLRAIEAQRNGNNKQAIEFASQAYAAGATTQTMLELAGYEKLAGNNKRSLELQNQWVEKHPQDIPARLALANDLLPENQVSDATAHYQAVLELDPDNITALNNLAWYLRLEDPKRALDYIRHAAELAPNRAEVLDTLAVIEHINGEDRRALRTVKRALEEEGGSGNPSILYHRAMIEAALDEKASATAILEQILAEGAANFPEQAEARELLARLQG